MYRMGLSPTAKYPNLQNGVGVEKSHYQIPANQLEIDKNVNRAHLRTHWLVVKWCHKQPYSIHLSPNKRTQIEHNMCGRRAGWSPLRWWPVISLLLRVAAKGWTNVAFKNLVSNCFVLDKRHIVAFSPILIALSVCLPRCVLWQNGAW